jgi:hypothetical protein
MDTRLRRGIQAVAAITAVTLAFWIWREPVLQLVGRGLVASDSLSRADIIVLGVAADGAGALEAADLVHAGVAPTVAVFEDPPAPVDMEFLRRGVPYEDERARSIRQLGSLGVTSIETIPRTVAGTEEEGKWLPEWCSARGFRSVIVVTTTDHSRRLSRVLRRTMRGRETRAVVRAARYSSFDERTWWHNREGVRIGIVEWQKLAFDFIRHPFS